MIYNSAVSELFYNNSYTKKLTLEISNGTITSYIDGSLIYAESLVLTESVCSSAELEPGSCEASVFQIKIDGKASNATDFNLTPILEIVDEQGVSVFSMTLGTRGIKSVEYDPAENSTVLTCYDALYDIIDADVSAWYNSLTFPISVENMLTSLMDNFGISMMPLPEISTKTLMLNKTADADDVISGSEVLRSLVQLLGAYGHINRDGMFEVFTIQAPPRMASVDIQAASCITADREEYRTRSITKIVVAAGDNKATARAEGTTTTNTYTLSNFLISDKSKAQLQEIADTLITVIAGYRYTPADVSVVGNPCLEVGDVYTYHGAEAFSSVILQRTLKGVQALIDNYTATGSYKRPTKTKFNSSFNSGGGGGGDGTATTTYINYSNKPGELKTIEPALPLSVGRGKMAAGTIGEYILFAGGSGDSSGIHSNVDVYDTDGTKTAVPNLSMARNRLAAANAGNHILFAGGSNSPGSNLGQQTIIDVYTAELTKLSSVYLTTAAYWLSGVSNGSNAVFAGGKSGSSTYINKVEAFDNALVKKSLTSLYTGRAEMTPGYINGRILFAGGIGSNVSTYIDAYNSELVKITGITSSMPRYTISEARCEMASANVGDYLLFGGGNKSSSSSPSAVVDAFSSAMVRSLAPALSIPRYYLSAAAIDNYAIFFGGRDSAAVNTIEAYDKSLTKNSVVTETPITPRYQGAAASVNGTAFFAGGINETNLAGIDTVDRIQYAKAYSITIYEGTIYNFGAGDVTAASTFEYSGSGTLSGYVKTLSKTLEGDHSGG